MQAIVNQLQVDGMLIILALLHTSLIAYIAVSLAKIAKNTKK
jgi:hypothetical protein